MVKYLFGCLEELNFIFHQILDAIKDHNKESLTVQKRTLNVVSTLFQPSCEDLPEAGSLPASSKLPYRPSSSGASSGVIVILPPESNPAKVGLIKYEIYILNCQDCVITWTRYRHG